MCRRGWPICSSSASSSNQAHSMGKSSISAISPHVKAFTALRQRSVFEVINHFALARAGAGVRIRMSKVSVCVKLGSFLKWGLCAAGKMAACPGGHIASARSRSSSNYSKDARDWRTPSGQSLCIFQSEISCIIPAARGGVGVGLIQCQSIMSPSAQVVMTFVTFLPKNCTGYRRAGRMFL